ncbi:hypothetical protein ACFQ1S_00925 [Kibdelosporangium lantanae]|uniref:WXG100 family type VII secretion target n=1 Tax=Kibdelosporangium lantanae TaxID=1497396 RepID=A0ABW3M2Z5_9PSEU
MGKFWKDDQVLYDIAVQLGANFAGLAIKGGGLEWSPEVVNAMRGQLLGNAADFLSLDPQKIIDEWERMQKAAKDVGVDMSDAVTVELGATKDHLQGWYGQGADAFRAQVDAMRSFTGQQFDFTTRAIQALAAMLKIAVQSREDFVALAQATIDKITKAFAAADDDEPVTNFLIKMGNGVAKAVLGVISDPEKAVFAIAENVLDISVEGVTYSVNGVKVADVVNSYVGQRDKLLAGYENELKMVADRLHSDQEQALTPSKLLTPLPLSLSVNSPDFRYDNFMSKDMDPGQFSPKVETERQKYAADKQDKPAGSDSPIQQRLAGK